MMTGPISRGGRHCYHNVSFFGVVWFCWLVGGVGFLFWWGALCMVVCSSRFWVGGVFVSFLVGLLSGVVCSCLGCCLGLLGWLLVASFARRGCALCSCCPFRCCGCLPFLAGGVSGSRFVFAARIGGVCSVPAVPPSSILVWVVLPVSHLLTVVVTPVRPFHLRVVFRRYASLFVLRSRLKLGRPLQLAGRGFLPTQVTSSPRPFLGGVGSLCACFVGFLAVGAFVVW